MASVPQGWEIEYEPEPLGFDIAAAADFGTRWGRVTSTSRTPEHNRKVGGVANSYHLTTRGAKAVDIARHPGVRHKDIEAAYRAAGYDLIESLDEGDHSHFAFGSGPAAEPPVANDIPEGWEIEAPEAPAPVSASFAPVGGGGEGADQGDARPLQMRATVDPAKVAQLQAAFDAGASLPELERMASEMGDLRFKGNLAASVEYRDKGGKGARLMPETVAVQPRAEPVLTSRDWEDLSIPQKAGEVMGDFARAIGHPYANRIGAESETAADWIPFIGGAASIERGKEDFKRGDYGAAALNAGLGSIDFIPAVGPLAGMIKNGGKHVVDAAMLRSIASAGDGSVDLARAGNELREAADVALASGGTVTLHVEGKAIPITKPGLVDDKGQSWGALPILSPKPGDNPRLEIDVPEAPKGGQSLAEQVGNLKNEGHRIWAERELWIADELERFQHSDQEVAGLAEQAGAAVEQRVAALTPFERNNPEIIQRIRREEIARIGHELDAISARTEKVIRSRAEHKFPGAVEPPKPARERDYIDVSIPKGWEVEPPSLGSALDDPALGRVRPMNERLSAEEVADLARGVDPEAVVPLPPNTVGSLEELEGATGGVQRQIAAPDPARELSVRNVNGRNRRGPADLVTWIREQPWALKDDGGELAQYGITNTPRRGVDFAGADGFFGSLVDNKNGRSLDDAAQAAWEAGYFPHHTARPSVSEFLDVLSDTHRGGNRAFRPDDMDEVARFEAAQADRDMIKAAEQEGAPLYEDIGETITLDDLDALTPPGIAYEDSPRLVGKVGNINLANIENTADVSRLIRQVQDRVGGFDAAARGRITHEETRRLADELGIRPEDILKRRQGQALNAEQLYALRVIVQKSRQVVAGLAKKAVGGSDADLALFRNAWMRHVAIEEQAAGATAEVGRALSQFRMLSKGDDAKGAAVKSYLMGGGGRETVEEAAQKLVDLMEDPAKASRFMREAAKTRKLDVINELWINSLLSGPRTHIVNFVSNAFTSAYQLPEQALTAGIGAVLRTEDRASLREVAARAVGLVQGAKDGWKLMKHAWKTGEPLDMVSRVEARNYQAIPGKVGHVIRYPTRALTAADELWKAINRRAATNAMAHRRAYTGSGTAEEKAQRFADLVSNPDKPLRDYADKQARYYTFQSELGEVGRLAQRGSNAAPGGKFILPFVRTPINLLKFAATRSPFAPLVKEFRDAIKAGGNERNEAMARVILGTGISSTAVVLALDGKISGGGPSDARERQALLNSGWQPYSVRVGDEWISYQRFEPFSMLLGAAADYTDVVRADQATPKEASTLALAMALATAKNITSKTWLSGPTDMFEVLSDPERYGRNYVERLLGSMAVPAVVAHAAGAGDPYLREVNTVLDAIKNRVPGLSDNLEARRNVWGEEIKRGSGAGQGVAGAIYNFISPIYTSSRNRDPFDQEIARLKAPLSMPQRQITSEGVKHKLTPEQYSYYVQLSGMPAKKYLSELMGSADWEEMTDEERREEVRDALEEFREDAREQLKVMYPELGAPSAPAPTEAAIPEGWEVVR